MCGYFFALSVHEYVIQSSPGYKIIGKLHETLIIVSNHRIRLLWKQNQIYLNLLQIIPI
jgi:hypothetical protein